MKYADFVPGTVLTLGPEEMTEAAIIEFARQYDPQPFHVDPVAARATRWGGVIASGLHTCSVAMRLVARELLEGSEAMGSPGLDHLRWPNPVRPGDQLTMRVEVLDRGVSKSGRVGSVRWKWTLTNQRAESVLELESTTLFSLV